MDNKVGNMHYLTSGSVQLSQILILPTTMVGGNINDM